MSKYTTEVRFICENKAGLDESAGANHVDEVLVKSWDKIFTSDVAIFDENYRATICKKILKHYYLREICCETVGIWLLWLNTKFEEIMPYYNQLYESAKLKFEPFYDTDYKRTSGRTVASTESGNGSSSTSSTTEGTNTGKTTVSESGSSTGKSTDKYADTPQGALTNVENGSYLTNARIVDTSGSNSGESTTNVTGSDSVTVNGTGESSSTGKKDTRDDFSESVSGKVGGASYSKLLAEYRETFLNIDMMVIDEFKDLFFTLW